MLEGGATSTFLLLGGSIMAGYAGQALFRRTRVSDILLLLMLGFVVGPLLGLIDKSVLAPAIPVLGPLGLAIILFEGGLELRWEDMRRHAGRALALSLLTWSLTTVALTFAAHYVLGLAPALAALFAVAVAATGIVAVIPLLAQLRAPPEARVLLTVETSLGDILSAVAVTAISSMLVLGAPAWVGGAMLGGQLLVGAAVGLLFGLAWSRALHVLGSAKHSYAMSLGVLLLAYAAASHLHGSGLLAAAVMGVVLGNAPALVRDGGLASLAPLQGSSRRHGDEMVFILRSIYFVFLGLNVSRDILAAPYVLAALALLGAMLAARVVAVLLVHRVRTPEDARTRLLLVGTMPRAMAAAVLATVPAAMGVPGTEAFLTYAFLVIVGADLATTAAVLLYERQKPTGVAPLGGADLAVVGKV